VLIFDDLHDFDALWNYDDPAATEQQDFYAIDAAHMLAIAAPAEQQLEWNLRALALAEQSPQRALVE
jgi:hypothetical protein